MQARDHAGAEPLLREVLLRSPDEPAAWTNLGVVLATLKREPEAEQCHRAAMRLAPGYRNARFNLAYLLLRQGRYEEGWLCLEARDWYAPFHKLLPFPRWQGEPLTGKRVLMGVEAGHGDMIQFCRYASLLKASGAVRVGVLCQPALVTLLENHAGIDVALGADQPLPSSGWDYWAPPLSLPFLFGTRLDSIPAALPYLAAAPARSERWQVALGVPPGVLRVGLVWSGNPRFENDAERSLPSPAVLAPLLDVPGVCFVSLQRDAVPAELAVVDLGAKIEDFADTAAIMSHLDLVITVDTATAHLAGALAKRCWVLLPDYQTDWRWLAGRTDSPWYPGVMTLFRQVRAGDWESVVQQVREALGRAARMTGHPT